VKVFAAYRHYWPDTAPYARMLRSILERLVEEGHEVSVLAGHPSYNRIQQLPCEKLETINGVTIRRIALLPEARGWSCQRVVNALYFFLRAVLHGIRNPCDIMHVNTHPPILGGLTAYLVHRIRGTRYVYHCLDIHPESSSVAGRIRKRLLYHWLTRIDRTVCARAERVVAPSQDLSQTLINRGWDGSTLRIIDNFLPEQPRRQRVDIGREAAHDPRFTLLFAGNLGAYQGLEVVIDAAQRLADRSEIHFIFMGEGRRKTELIRRAGQLVGQTVHFLPYLPGDVAFSAMQQMDLGIVSLAPGMDQVAVPSKTISYLMAGCPVLAVIEPTSQLAWKLREGGCAFIPKSRTAAAVAEAVLEAYSQRHRFDAERRREVAAYGYRVWGPDAALGAWSRLYAELQGVPSPLAEADRCTRQTAA
jgi:glycosyltransferase involved in cell wall biosynthesis